MSKVEMKLYEAADALRYIDELLVESGGELTPEIEELMAKAEGDFDQKVVQVALKVRELRGASDVCKAQADTIKAEADRLGARAKAYKNAADSLVAYIDRQFKALERTAPVQHPLVTVKYDKLPDQVEVDENVADLFELCQQGWEYVTINDPTFTVDKKALLHQCKAAFEAARRENPKLSDDEIRAALRLPKGFTFVNNRTTLRVK